MEQKNKGGQRRKNYPGEKRGPKYIITDDVLVKLREAFVIGATDVQACYYAGISVDALYDYQNRVPNYASQKEAMKKSLGLQAKANVAKSIKGGDIGTSKWHLEKTEKETYADRTELTAKDGEALNPQTKSVDEEILANYFKNKYGEKK